MQPGRRAAESQAPVSAAERSEPVSRRIIRATLVVTAITVGVKGLGFVEKLLLAYFFGTGMEVDAYLVAYSLPFSAYIVLREVVKPAFLPTFLRTSKASGEDGRRLFGAIGTLLALLLGGLSLAGVLLADPLISLAAPGFDGAQRVLAVRLVRLVAPALLFLGLSTLTTATLHAQKRFVLPALGEASLRAGPILLLLAAGGVQAVALGVLLGALGKLVLESLGLGRYLRRIRPSLDLAFGPVRKVAGLAAPLLAALSLSLFVAPLVENAFASGEGVGGVAALAYARKIVETLTTILPYTLGLVLLPFSAEMAARRDSAALASTLSASVRALTFLFLPVTVGLMVLRAPFVRLLFERGAFTAASTELTAGPLFFYALALLPFVLEVVVIQFFFARQDTLTPVATDVAAFVLNVALIWLLMPSLGLGGIALAAALAKGAKVLALLLLFGGRVPAFRPASLLPFLARMVLSALAAAGVLLLVEGLGQQLPPGQGFVADALYLAVAALSGGGAFFLVAYLCGVEEARGVWQQTRHWLRGLGGDRQANGAGQRGDAEDRREGSGDPPPDAG